MTQAAGAHILHPVQGTTAMKHALFLLVLALAGCTGPLVVTDLTLGNGGVAISPNLPGGSGDGTVMILP